MKEQPNILAGLARALTITTNTLEIRSDSPSRNGDGGLDANGISGIVIGILGLLVAIAGLITGLKFWRKRAAKKQNGRDIDMEASRLEVDGSTIVNHVWNIHISAQVAAPTPTVLPHRSNVRAGLDIQGQPSPPELRDVTPRERVLTWPSHSRLR